MLRLNGWYYNQTHGKIRLRYSGWLVGEYSCSREGTLIRDFRCGLLVRLDETAIYICMKGKSLVSVYFALLMVLCGRFLVNLPMKIDLCIPYHTAI